MGIADIDESKKQLAADYGIQFKKDFHELLPLVDALTLATPASTHYPIAADCLLAGKQLLVEKPLSLNYTQSIELVQLACQKNLVLAVGHLYRLNPAVIRLKNELKHIGQLQNANLRYVNLNQQPPSDCDIVFDYGSHLVDIALFLWNELPEQIYCSHSNAKVPPEKAKSAMILLSYSNFTAALELSWLHPHKYRDACITGRENTIYTNFLKQTMVRYDIKTNPDSTSIKDQSNISITRKEPLKEEISHFITCVEKGLKPINNGQEACEVVKLCEYALESSKTGRKIKI